MDQIVAKLKEILESKDLTALLASISEQIFEKDDDKNGHVDLITAMCNLRARNYKLNEMDWIQVKLKAGKIVPALATTTASIAALQTIEAIKIVKKLQLKDFRNAFLNMAVPLLTLSEPGPVIKSKIREGLEVTVWDQWDYKIDDKTTLFDMFEHIRKEKGIEPVDVFKGKKVIFFEAVNDIEEFKEEPLKAILDLEAGEYCHLSVICKLDKTDEKML